MENEVRMFNRNLVCVNEVRSVEKLQDDECCFQTKLGTIKVCGMNLEILKLDMQNQMAVISGTIQAISY